MSNIRVTYSGLITFVVGLASVFTGMIFVLIVTRRLSPEEFGIWSLIGSVVAYFLISESLISFWSLRQIARGKEVGRTSLGSSLIFSFISIPLYLIYVTVISQNSDAELLPMIIGSILLPVYFVGKIITNINLATKPQIASYGTMIFEAVKIPIALAFVVFLNLGVEGVIYSVFIAFLLRIFVQMYFARNKLKDKFSFLVLKRWFKISWIPLYSNLPKYIGTADQVIFLVITGGVIGVAFYNAALAIGTMIRHSAGISHALYPKLLADGSFDYVKDIFIRLLYFALPLLGITVIFSKPAIFALNPEYQDAYLIAILLSFKTFFMVLSNAIMRVLKGIEKVDVGDDPHYSKLIKSSLFTIPTALIIQSGIYIGLMILGLLFLISNSVPLLELVTWWALSALILEIPFLIYWWVKLQHKIKFSFPINEIGKYLIGIMSFIAVFFITSESLITYEISIFDFLPGLILQFIICTFTYFAVTYAIDKKTRNLVKSILNEIKPKK